MRVPAGMPYHQVRPPVPHLSPDTTNPCACRPVCRTIKSGRRYDSVPSALSLQDYRGQHSVQSSLEEQQPAPDLVAPGLKYQVKGGLVAGDILEGPDIVG